MGRTIERLETKKEGLVVGGVTISTTKGKRGSKLRNIGYFALKSYKCKKQALYLLANLAILGFKEVPYPC